LQGKSRKVPGVAFHVIVVVEVVVIPHRAVVPGKNRLRLNTENARNLNACLKTQIQRRAVGIAPGKGRIPRRGIETEGGSQTTAQKEPVVFVGLTARTGVIIKRLLRAKAPGLYPLFGFLGRNCKRSNSEQQKRHG
jgi:hypothetical protein